MSTGDLVPLFGPIYGSFYFGAILTTAFYGITCMQTFFYYVHYQNDPFWMKIVVAFVWAVNTIHEALIVSGTYKYLTVGLVNPSSVMDESVELIVQILPMTFAAIMTQGLLLYRIYVLSGKKFIAPVVWAILGLGQLVVVATYLGKALSSDDGAQSVTLFVLGEDSFVTLASVGLTVAVAEDILIAAFMTILLVRARNGTEFVGTVHILQRLTAFAVNTGTWTATFALLSLIFLHAVSFPIDNLYAVFLVPLCSVYCNTLLANLNARVYIGGQSMDVLSASRLSAPVYAVNPNKRDGEDTWKTTEVMTRSDADRSTPSADV